MPEVMTEIANKSTGRGAFLLEEQVAHLLRRAHQRASSLFINQLSAHHLTPTQFFAMARLHEKGRLSQNLLGRKAAMDPATIQGVIQRLNEKGYIRRTPDPMDRRRMVLELTESGRDVVQSLIEGAMQVNNEVIAPLDDLERDEFIRLLHKVT